MSSLPETTTDGIEYAWGIATLYPPQGEWTEEEYLSLTDSRRGVEFVDGRLAFLPMPTEIHQTLLRLLFLALDRYVEEKGLGKVLFAGLRVKTREAKIREPDLVFLHKDNFAQRGNRYWEGANLVMEVVSDDAKDRERDYETKFAEYAQAGIAEYWVIDYEKRLVSVFKLDGDAYAEHCRIESKGLAQSASLEGFSVDIGALFAEADEVPR